MRNLVSTLRKLHSSFSHPSLAHFPLISLSCLIRSLFFFPFHLSHLFRKTIIPILPLHIFCFPSCCPLIMIYLFSLLSTSRQYCYYHLFPAHFSPCPTYLSLFSFFSPFYLSVSLFLYLITLFVS